MTTTLRDGLSRFVNGLGGAGFTVISNIGIALAGVFTGLLVARGLGAEQRGLYALIWSCFWLAFVVAEIGMPYAICHYVARNPIWARAVWRKAILLQTPAVIVMCSLALALSSSITPRADQEARIVFASVPIFVFGNSIISTLMGISSLAWNVARLVQPGIYLLIVVALTFRSPTFSLEEILIALVGSQVVGLIWSALSMRRISLSGEQPRNLPSSQQLISYAVPAFLSTLPAVTTAKLDQLVLGSTGHVFELGLYAVGVTISTAVYPVAQALGATALRSLPATTALRGNAAAHSRAASAVAWAAFVVTSILAILTWLFARDVLGSDFDHLWIYVALLAPASWGLAFSRVKGDILRGVNEPRVAAKIDMTCMGLTVVGVLCIVPWAGAIGASLVSSIVALFSALLIARAVDRGDPAPGSSDVVPHAPSNA